MLMFFCITFADLSPIENLTKRKLVSDIAKVFDVLGWFAPSTIKVKILLQRVWELGVEWDEPVPETILSVWKVWRLQLSLLKQVSISRCYFPKDAAIVSYQVHGFCDASEEAYSGVVYLRMLDLDGNVHVSLVMSKTKVAPIKRISIPRLELCGAQVLAKLLHHVKDVLQLSASNVYAWTDSEIVLHWLSGNPRRFKTYVGNRVSDIISTIAPEKWSHVPSAQNPADCASRGILPSELVEHELWWNGPSWLKSEPSCWPKWRPTSVKLPVDEEREISLVTVLFPEEPVVPFDRYSSLSHLVRIVAWVLRFVNNCKPLSECNLVKKTSCLTTPELLAAERYLIKFSQCEFATELALLNAKKPLPRGNRLISLRPFIDKIGVLRVGGRESNASLSYVQTHPAILHGKHPFTKMLILSEHLRLLHAGPTLVLASLSRRFHVSSMKKIVRSVVRKCTTCRRFSARPSPQLMGQLPVERVTPGTVFEKVGVDYAGPVLVKYGTVRKPTVLKAYICVFVSLTVKAVHLEVVSSLTSEAFVAALRRFVARRGHPSLIWSDNGTNFVGTNRELREMHQFLLRGDVQHTIINFCSSIGIEWKFIPERSPHFGGLWEAAVKSTKKHLRRIVGDVKLTFEELATVLTQVEACLNSRPLAPLNTPDVDGVEVLTPSGLSVWCWEW